MSQLDQIMNPSQELSATLDELGVTRLGSTYLLHLSAQGALTRCDGVSLGKLERLVFEGARASWRHLLGRSSLPSHMDICLTLGAQVERWWVEWEQREGGGWRGFATPAQSELWRRRLIGRELGLSGLRHDLNNRLFMLRALPDLSEMLTPEELVEDLMEDLPGTLAFITDRLSAEWLQSQQVTRLTLKERRQQVACLLALLQRRGVKVEGRFERGGELEVIQPDVGTQALSPALVGVLWSMSALGGQLRPAQQLEWAQQNSDLSPLSGLPLQLTLHYELTLSPQLTRCGQLSLSGPVSALTLSGGGVPWSRWLELCPAPRHSLATRPLSHTLGLGPNDSLERFISQWLEGWLSASDLLEGVIVYAGEHEEGLDGLSICFP